MNIWDFLQPIFGVDVRFPVTVVFLIVVFVWALVINRSFVFALLIVALDVFFMRWFPGITMVGTCLALAMVQGLLYMIDLVLQVGQADQVQDRLEYLPDGSLVGFKWLTRRTTAYRGSRSTKWCSPVEGILWDGDDLTAHKDPSLYNFAGIYVYYSEEIARRAIYNQPGSYLVKVACDGKVVYHETGARVKHVAVIQVLQFGG